MNRYLILFWVLCLGIPPITSAAEPAARSCAKVLFVGIDGCRFDAVEAAQASQLLRLQHAGAYSTTARILGDRYRGNDTVSGPGWSSILTGVWADKHGVNDNTFRGSRYDEFPDLFAHLKPQQPQARAASFVTWSPIQERIVQHAAVSQTYVRGKEYVAADEACTQAVIAELQQRDPDVLFFYIGQVDEFGHQYGFHPAVPEYLAAIVRADGLLHRVLEAIRARPTWPQENWLTVITSDHGGQGTGHGGGHDKPEILNSFLIVHGPAAIPGPLADPTYIVDAPATVLKHLGVDLNRLPKLDGRPRGLK